MRTQQMNPDVFTRSPVGSRANPRERVEFGLAHPDLYGDSQLLGHAGLVSWKVDQLLDTAVIDLCQQLGIVAARRA
jgi:hypothetical protein